MDVQLRGDGPSSVTINDAVRGLIDSGEGDDIITINPGAGGGNDHFIINGDGGNDTINLDVAVDVTVQESVAGGDISLTINGTTNVTLEAANTGAFDGLINPTLDDLIINGLQVDFNPDTFAT